MKSENKLRRTSDSLRPAVTCDVHLKTIGQSKVREDSAVSATPVILILHTIEIQCVSSEIASAPANMHDAKNSNEGPDC